MRHPSSIAPATLIARLLTVVAASACGPMLDDDVIGQSGAVVYQTDYSMDVGVTRHGRLKTEQECSQVCTDWVVVRTKGDFDVEKCVKWETQCGQVSRYNALFRDQADQQAESPFPAFNTFGDQGYLGCGPQAILNVLNWYGIKWKDGSLYAIYVDTPTWQAPEPWTESIATTPEALANTLRTMLNSNTTDDYFTVGVGAPGFLLWGDRAESDPIIALVNGGSHWQTITGFRNVAGEHQYFVIDYPGGGQWVPHGALRRSLEGGAAIWSDLTTFQGYESNVLIGIRRQRPVNLTQVNTATTVAYTSGDPWGAPASRGMDNNTNGAWSGGSVFHTGNTFDSTWLGVGRGGEYWWADLQRERKIKRVVLHNRTDCCQDRLSHFRINYFDAWSQSWKVASDQSNTITSAANPTISINIDVSTQYLMVQKTDNNYLHLAEVEIFGFDYL